MKRFFCTAAMAMCLAFSGCGGASEPERTEPKEFVLPAEERGTSAMTDALTSAARADAEEAVTADLQAALDFIRDNYPDFYVDDETMEKTIYYGALLQYYFDDIQNDFENYRYFYVIGRDAYEAVKYVYRGYETVETESTQINLESIGETIPKIK